MRVLDEVAEAIRRAREPWQRPVLTPFGLEQQFDHTITPREWNAIRDHLACRLPPLEFVQGHWFLPNGFETIWDLVDHVARFRHDLERPTTRTAEAWREAQVFAGVRQTIVDACYVEPEEVTREARIKDLVGD